jgi:N-acetylmuramoyl-L-alanine amidase
VVIHIMDGTLHGTDTWFLDPASRVSAHYGVGATGTVHQYVAEGDAAWHAGRRYNPTWKLIKDTPNPNFYTIGIEHEGEADTPWSDAMLGTSARLVMEICPGTWIDLDDYVTRVRQLALDPASYTFVGQAGSVQARVDLNLRVGAPTALAPKARTVPGGSTLEYTGWTSNGLTVNGNAHWYRTTDGEFFWAGATTGPAPG